MDLILKNGDKEYLIAKDVSKDALAITSDFLTIMNDIFTVIEEVEFEIGLRVL